MLGKLHSSKNRAYATQQKLGVKLAIGKGKATTNKFKEKQRGKLGQKVHKAQIKHRQEEESNLSQVKSDWESGQDYEWGVGRNFKIIYLEDEDEVIRKNYISRIVKTRATFSAHFIFFG